MSKGLKYILGFDSDLNNEISIEIWEEGFQGEATNKALGSSPGLVRDSAENGIFGTSIELSIEANFNDELIGFYTVDNKKYLVVKKVNGVPTWMGHTLPEKYSEQYVDAPYDVEVIASDGLGTLKDVPFEYTGEHTILEILKLY